LVLQEEIILNMCYHSVCRFLKFKIYSIRVFAAVVDAGVVGHPTVCHSVGTRKYHFKKSAFCDKNLAKPKNDR
jgi:hypothetical protein